MAKTHRVAGYRDGEQRREKLEFETYQYRLPFNYRNVSVFRKYYEGGEFHGMELEPTNPPSTRLTVTQCTKDTWFRVGARFVVPPRALRAQVQVQVAQQRRGETLLIDDVSSIVVPHGWRETDRVPAGVRNMVRNPGFEQVDTESGFPRHWEMTTLGKGTCEVADANVRRGKRAMAVKGVSGIALCQNMAGGVTDGQQLYMSMWLTSSRPDPKAILLFPQFYDAHGAPVSDFAGDCIIVREEKPIVRVVVIGSACTPPGYVQVECEELASWRRKDELRSIMPVRFRINNLWGMHMRVDQWCTRTPDVQRFQYCLHPFEDIPQGLIEAYPGLAGSGMKSDGYESPLAGMSSAIFEVPPCEKVIIRGGSEMPGWSSDHFPNDGHYSFRIIRTTVAK